MNTYQITYNDKSSEYVEAYGWKQDGKRYVFDIGHGASFVAVNVKRVVLVG